MSRSLLILLALVAVGCIAPAVASARDLTRAQAIRAVERDVDATYGNTPNEVVCKKITAKRQRCQFHLLTRRDITEGNVGGHSGIAYVRRYSYGIDVRITGYHRGY
jgi:hypothetical protein